MIKPRITLHHYVSCIALSVYRCFGGGISGYGNSREAAYRSWLVQYDAEQARKFKLAEKFSPAP